MTVWGEGSPGGGIGAPYLSPHLPWACLTVAELQSFTISQYFSEICELRQRVDHTQGGGCWNLQPIRGPSGAQVINWARDGHLKPGLQPQNWEQGAVSGHRQGRVRLWDAPLMSETCSVGCRQHPHTVNGCRIISPDCPCTELWPNTQLCFRLLISGLDSYPVTDDQNAREKDLVRQTPDTK